MKWGPYLGPLRLILPPPDAAGKTCDALLRPRRRLLRAPSLHRSAGRSAVPARRGPWGPSGSGWPATDFREGHIFGGIPTGNGCRPIKGWGRSFPHPPTRRPRAHEPRTPAPARVSGPATRPHPPAGGEPQRPRRRRRPRLRRPSAVGSQSVRCCPACGVPRRTGGGTNSPNRSGEALRETGTLRWPCNPSAGSVPLARAASSRSTNAPNGTPRARNTARSSRKVSWRPAAPDRATNLCAASSAASPRSLARAATGCRALGRMVRAVATTVGNLWFATRGIQVIASPAPTAGVTPGITWRDISEMDAVWPTGAARPASGRDRRAGWATRVAAPDVRRIEHPGGCAVPGQLSRRHGAMGAGVRLTAGNEVGEWRSRR